MTKPLLAILLLLTVCLRGYSANPDDAAWLIYDVSYGDYFLLRIDMKTTRTGTAEIAGGNHYAGRRATGLSLRMNRFKVNITSGTLNISKKGAVPFMQGSINQAGDEYSGYFLNDNGKQVGRFVGALQGHTYHQMDLFQLCKRSSGKYDPYQCVNRGNNQRCYHPRRNKKSTFFTKKNCEAELKAETGTSTP
jgi:hypothetical protein